MDKESIAFFMQEYLIFLLPAATTPTLKSVRERVFCLRLPFRTSATRFLASVVHLVLLPPVMFHLMASLNRLGGPLLRPTCANGPPRP